MTYPSPDHHIDTHNREHYPEPTGSAYETREHRLSRNKWNRELEQRHEALLIELYGERYWENYQYTKTHANYDF